MLRTVLYRKTLECGWGSSCDVTLNLLLKKVKLFSVPTRKSSRSGVYPVPGAPLPVGRPHQAPSTAAEAAAMADSPVLAAPNNTWTASF